MLRPALLVPLLVGGLAALSVSVGAPALATASHSPIAGSGSSWSSNAVNQWVADVEPNGLQVVFTASGSAIGRKDFANKTTDFAVSDIGYQGTDKLTGEQDTSQGRAYVYLPIVAGGTAFPYQVKVGGKLVRNLRLSGLTLAKIFTNQITNWNDPAITRDNHGKALPSKPIIPVVHSEGSGSSAQFTKYLDTVYPQVWRPFLGSSGATEYFPRKGDAIAQNGSDGVMNYVASDAADGAIGYDEFSYALGKNFPVAKVENAGGYFTQPTQYGVAVALTKAKINTDKSSSNYLLQDLSQVYTYADKRTYPLSSYSYMIIPTGSSDSRMTTAKRQTLADYLYYSICDGQKEMGPIGYSPLPINLAQASFDQIAKLKQADSNVDLTKRNISTCGNPTFIAGQPNRNYLAEIAPQPPACDAVTSDPCAAGTALVANPTKSGQLPSTGAGATATGTTGGRASTSGAAGTAAGGPAATGAVVPGTATGTTGGTPATTGLQTQPVAEAVPTELSAGRRPVSSAVLAPLAVLLLVAAVVAPPLLSRRLAAGDATTP
ncbi:MAG: phosphate transporter substrate-binding protein PhoT family [Frankiales bacterium]|nr:phosphate transporter substrate-binding protein PhoT family [Frankiales bacterium]